MSKKLTASVFLLAFLLVGQPLLAQTALTEDNVKRFVDSYETIYEIAKEHESSFDTKVEKRPGGKAPQPFSDALSAMRGQAIYDEVVAAMKSHGFSDPIEWASVGNRVVQVVVALMSEEQMPEIETKMADAMAKLDEMEISDAQKEAMRSMMETAGRQGAAIGKGVTEKEKAAVRPSLERIKNWENLD